MAREVIYEITINKATWDKHQGDRKRGYRHIMLHENFLDDDKILQLTTTQILMYLSCLLVASQLGSNKFRYSRTSLIRTARVRPRYIQSSLDRLQSFQLLTYVVATGPLEGTKLEGKELVPPPDPEQPELLPRDLEPKPDYRVLFEIWNQYRGDLPKAKHLNPQRSKAMRARWSERSDAEFWVSLAKFLASSPWHTGKSRENRSGWTADFDFFVNTTTHIKFDEGTLSGQERLQGEPEVFDYTAEGNRV